MTNAEKYKSPDERRIAYEDYCKVCEKEDKALMDEFWWLDLEYKEELKNCPFCGGKAGVVSGIHEGCEYHWVECSECYGRSIGTSLADRTIAAWNRRV